MYCIWLTGVHARSHTSLLLCLPSSQQLLLFCMYTGLVVSEHNARLPCLTSVWSAKEIQQRKPRSKKANDCVLPLNNKIWYWSNMFSVIAVTIQLLWWWQEPRMDTFCFTMSLFSTTKHTIQTLVNVLRYDRHTNSLVSQEDLIKARHMEDIELYCWLLFLSFLSCCENNIWNNHSQKITRCTEKCD